MSFLQDPGGSIPQSGRMLAIDLNVYGLSDLDNERTIDNNNRTSLRGEGCGEF